MVLNVEHATGSDAGADSRTSLDKGLDVLLAFDSPLPTRGVTDLARDVGLPKSTVHRILATFVRAGLVVRLPNGRYQLGVRLFELGSIFYRQTQLRTIAAPYLHELYQRTRLTVYLTVLDGDEIMHLDHLPAPDAPRITMTIGRRWSLHTSSAGKLFLAYAPRDTVDAYVQRGLKPLTPYSIVSPAVLLEQLATIRRQGYATAADEGVIGISGLAAPVFDKQGDVVAAVGIASSGSAVLDFAGPAVQTARAISAKLPRKAWIAR